MSNLSANNCPGRPVPPSRYFLSEKLIWSILTGLVKDTGKQVSRLTKQDVVRFVRDHTCPICGRVFLSKINLLSHHAIREFNGIYVVDPDENTIDLSELFPNFGQSRTGKGS